MQLARTCSTPGAATIWTFSSPALAGTPANTDASRHARTALARVAVARAIAARAALAADGTTNFFIADPSCDRERYARDHVVVITGRVGHEVRHLCFAALVGGLHQHELGARALGLERARKLAERKSAQIIGQRSGGPKLSGVEGH